MDFTVLQTQGRDFFRNFFFQLFVSSQVSSPAISSKAEAGAYLTGHPRTRESLEKIFIGATRVPTLSQGLIYFLTNVFRGENRRDDEVSQTLKWACDVAKDTLRTGVDVVASLT